VRRVCVTKDKLYFEKRKRYRNQERSDGKAKKHREAEMQFGEKYEAVCNSYHCSW
jgi:hypothetical protein